MKKRKTFSALTTEELTEKKKQIKGAMIGLGIILLAAVIIMIYLSFKTDKKQLYIIISSACMITFMPILIYLSLLDTEIKKRKIQ